MEDTNNKLKLNRIHSTVHTDETKDREKEAAS